MAFAFPREAPILHFTLRPHVDDVEKRSNVLWPVWGYRVVAPQIRERALNVLQKAVLGLCRTGLRTAEHISNRLHIHHELAAFIILELQERQLLQSNGLPTSEGIEVLREETVESHRSVAGYVFQDACFGELWPRFIERLEYAETERNAGGFPILVFGTWGSRKRIPTHLEWAVETPRPPPPEAREILLATRRHRAALERSRTLSPWDPEMNEDEPMRAVLINRVSMIEDQPQPFFLSTYVYIAAKLEDGTDWHVCDPFGFGAAPWLRRAIEARFERSPRLHQIVKSLFEGNAAEKIQEHRRHLAQLRERVALGLPPAARGLPFYDSLVDALQGAEEVRLLGHDISEFRLRAVLVTARVTLEKSFRYLAQTHPTADAWRLLYARDEPTSDHAYVEQLYDTSAEVVGFSLPIPKPLRTVPPEQLRAAAEGRASWRLRALIMAGVMRARDDMTHPLRAAAAKAPQLLAKVEAIVHAGGDGAHAGDRYITAELVHETIDGLVHVMELLHDLSVDRIQHFA